MITGLKCCSSCHEYKDLKLFHRNKNKKDGRSWECIDCQKKRKSIYNKIARENRAMEKRTIANRETHYSPTDGIPW